MRSSCASTRCFDDPLRAIAEPEAVADHAASLMRRFRRFKRYTEIASIGRSQLVFTRDRPIRPREDIGHAAEVLPVPWPLLGGAAPCNQAPRPSVANGASALALSSGAS